MKLKKVLSLGLAAVMTVSMLVACGKAEETDGGSRLCGYSDH